MVNGISFNATSSPYYKEIVRKIYAPASYNKMSTSLLDSRVTKMPGLMEDLKQSWFNQVVQLSWMVGQIFNKDLC